ncbi:MAG: hypothetical protein II822_10430 [Prevotella sp.]|nr:hypothetical protein [Prevotella sp.]
MADVITRFKLETTQYDSKLRDAAKGLADYTKQAMMAGNEFGKFTQKNADAARALGNISVSSTNAKDKVKELVGAFNDVARQYNNLTKEQQQSDFGKAMAESMTMLKGRISAAKQEMNSTGGVLEQLASKFTINIDALKLFNAGVAAAKAALDVVKDAFFASESNVDEWGRTVQSAESIYQSFLQSLNNSDFSGFLSGIGNVITAAREAYNAIDELGTRQTILNPERARIQSEMTRQKAIIRRSGADSAEGRAAAQELKRLEKSLTTAWQTESKLNRNAFEALVRERLADANINLNQKSFQRLMKTFESDAAFQQLRKNAKGSITSESTGNAYNPNATTTRRTIDTRNTEAKIMDLFTDVWRQKNSGYLTASYNADNAAASTLLGDARYLRNGNGTSSSSGNLTSTAKNVGDIIADQFITAMRKANLADVIPSEQEGPSAAWQAFTEAETKKESTVYDAIVALNKKEGVTPSGEKKDRKERDRSAVDVMSQMNSGISSIVSGIEGLGIELPAGMKEMVGGISSVLSVLQGIAILVQGIEAIQKISTFLGFSHGGIVPHAASGYMIPGNDYSDRTPVLAQSGELILNRAQQGNLASQLSGQGAGGGYTPSHVSGEQIWIALNAFTKRTGKGELVTWK